MNGMLRSTPHSFSRGETSAAGEPKVTVLAGLSTEPIGQRVSADDIL